MTLHSADLLLVKGAPFVAFCLSETGAEVAWHAEDGVRTGNVATFLGGRTAEVLRLPDPLCKLAAAAFPPSLDPRHGSIPERELTAFLMAGQQAALNEAIPFLLSAARAQIGRNFLADGASEAEHEAAATLFVLNSLRCVECCHGVIPRLGLSSDDLRHGAFLHPVG